MPYKYVAYTADLMVVEGTINVSTEQQAREVLQQSGYKLLTLNSTKPPLSLHRLMPSIFAVKGRDVVAFSNQLATLLERGVTTLAALELLRDQNRSGAFKDVVTGLIQDIQQGNSFSEAISHYPQAFPPFYCRMIKATEQTGNLDETLRRLASYIDKENALIKKVSMAMVYPAFLAVLAVGVVFLMFTFTLPPLMELFAEFDAELPITTQLLVAIVEVGSTYGLYLALAAVVVVSGIIWYLRTPAGRYRIAEIVLKAPMIGSITALREMSHFSRTTGMALNAGLPMTETMDAAIQTSRNLVIRKALEDVRHQLIEGNSFSHAISGNDLFPRFLTQVVKVGETSGTLSEDLLAVAESYERDVEDKVNTMMGLMEPVMLVVLGGIVGFIAVSIIMPIYSIMGSI